MLKSNFTEGGLRSINCPGCNIRGFSIPLAPAMACQLSPEPGLAAAMPCNVLPAGASDMGAVPGADPPRSVTPGALLVWLNLNSVIFCCDSVMATLARSGLPSKENSSSVSSSDSMMPSNWKEPHINRTAGGMYFFQFDGIM